MKIVKHINFSEFVIEESDAGKVFCVVLSDKDSLENNEKEFFKEHIFPRESSIIVSNQQTIEGLFTELGITKSKTDARNQNRSGKISTGFTDIENIGKLKKNVIIWNTFGEIVSK